MKKSGVFRFIFANAIANHHIMKWNFIINGAPLGIGEASGGFAPRKKEWVLGALAGASAAASLASTIWGGSKAAEQQAKAEAELRAEKARNEAWYTRRYNESYADTAAGQNMIRMAKDAAREHWRREAGAAAVAGGTDAAAAMAKEAGNKMVGDAIAQVAAQDTARKDSVDAAYRAERSRLSQQQMALDQQKAANISQVAGGVSDALMSGAVALAGTGSPGGGGVDPAAKTSQIEKTGISGSEKWMKNADNWEKAKDFYQNYGKIYDPETGMWLSKG